MDDNPHQAASGVVLARRMILASLDSDSALIEAVNAAESVPQLGYAATYLTNVLSALATAQADGNPAIAEQALREAADAILADAALTEAQAVIEGASWA
ncbi:hypothetical protein GCM10023221_36570 [Luteimicrobium xylanilyticum]|uniref:Uncharacterized protein n=1 Tax=Luteimicrobium xylanilyticum TaxID=1133546 RepID=A0A5P9QBQ8_9MICO|nr:hypothetical protein [Luteimicrobium xylanilyticum]QFU97885.1 hypothetical protein KDY119_01391 [Luteimicrobium xylanilyticum]